jgi:hypothetical protein
MNIDLNQNDLITLREVLQQHVTDLDREINATDSSRYKNALRDTERQLERILGVVTGAIEPAAAPPRDWEPRDDVRDVDKSRL